LDYDTESSLEVLEGGSLRRLIRPTLKHDMVQTWGTVGWERQPLPILYLADYFIVFDTLEGLDAIHKNLPHTHTKHPNVTGNCKSSEVD